MVALYWKRVLLWPHYHKQCVSTQTNSWINETTPQIRDVEQQVQENSLSEQGNAGLTQNKVTRTLRAELWFTCKYDYGGDGLCKTLDRDRSHTFYDRDPCPVIRRRYSKTWAKYLMRKNTGHQLQNINFRGFHHTMCELKTTKVLTFTDISLYCGKAWINAWKEWMELLFYTFDPSMTLPLFGDCWLWWKESHQRVCSKLSVHEATDSIAVKSLYCELLLGDFEEEWDRLSLLRAERFLPFEKKIVSPHIIIN